MHKCSIAGIVVIAVACTSEPVTGVSCPAIMVPGIAVTPLDRAANVVRIQGLLVVTDKSFADTAVNAPTVDPKFYAAYERPGTYDVKLEIPGYAPWKMDGVVVRSDICGVTTVPLAATLVEASSP